MQFKYVNLPPNLSPSFKTFSNKPPKSLITILTLYKMKTTFPQTHVSIKEAQTAKNQENLFKIGFSYLTRAILVMIITAFLPNALLAQWNTNTSINEEISSFSVADMETVSTTDGKTWVAFYHQNGSVYEMHAQLFDANGYKLLGPDGVLVGNQVSGSATFVFNVCIDQDNNLIIAYQDQRTGSSYTATVYKISQTGAQLWNPTGVVIGTGLAPYPVTLSTGEVAVTWNDEASNTLKIQKISTAGATVFTTPVSVMVGTTKTTRGQIVANSSGAFTMVYQKSGSGISTTLYAQKFTNAGVAVYAPLQICNQTTSGARYYSIVADADTTYFGYYSSTGFRFNSFVQRINPNGTIPWGINGSSFNTSTGGGDSYQGTTYINQTPGSPYVWSVCTFSDPNQSLYGVYIQKFLKSTGARQFSDQGKVVYAISTNRDSQEGDLSLVDDTPMFMSYSYNYKIKATRLDGNGNFVWPGNSVEISSTTSGAGSPKGRYGFADNGPNKCVGIWTETRSSVEKGYAQGVSIGGLVGIDVATQGGVPAVITVNQGVLQMVASVFPATANQNVTWSVVAVTGTASINSAGLLTAQVDGTVWAKATSVQDITMSDSLLVTLSGQSGIATPPPTGATVQTFCYGATVANLVASGTDLKWYSTPIGGSPIPSFTLLVNNNHYFGSQTIGGIESTLRLEVVVVVTTTVAPTGPALQNFCAQGTVAGLVANGTSIQWYSTPTGGTPLLPSTALVNGSHYYATQTLSGCESFARFDVTVTVTALPSAPTGGIFQNFCEGATVSDLIAVGSNILWYDVPTGGSPLLFGAALVNGSHYYASQSVSGCESLTRLDVLVTVVSTPAPTASVSQSFCTSGTVANLTATGSSILWYAAATGGNPLPTNTPLTNGTHYFASQTVSGCESFSRFEVTVSIITVNTSVTQIGVTLTAVATGAGYQWLNCTTNAIINGAVGQSYTATQNGIYAVVVTQNNCSDTSVCISILTVGLAREIAANGIKVFPNPTSDFVTVNVSPDLLGSNYMILDKLGKVVFSGIFKDENTNINLSGCASGLYSLVYGSRNQHSFQLLKKD